jgi:hypothetical protein
MALLDRLWRAPTSPLTTRPAAPATLPADVTAGATVDACYHLLKVATDATYLLDGALHPRSYGVSALDLRLPWLVYTSLRFAHPPAPRHGQGGGAVGPRLGQGGKWGLVMTEDRLGRASSVRDMPRGAQAARLHVAYAAQLAQAGLVPWAVFVLLHLDDSARCVRPRLLRSLTWSLSEGGRTVPMQARASRARLPGPGAAVRHRRADADRDAAHPQGLGRHRQGTDGGSNQASATASECAWRVCGGAVGGGGAH